MMKNIANTGRHLTLLRGAFWGCMALSWIFLAFPIIVLLGVLLMAALKMSPSDPEFWPTMWFSVLGAAFAQNLFALTAKRARDEILELAEDVGLAEERIFNAPIAPSFPW